MRPIIVSHAIHAMYAYSVGPTHIIAMCVAYRIVSWCNFSV